MNSNGSNLNAGSTCSDVGGGSNSAVYTSQGGNFDGTSLFTPTDGQTTSTKVAIGDWVALCNTGDAQARCIVKVSNVAAGLDGAITVDVATRYGTVPTVNSGSRECRAGGSLASWGITATNGAMNTGSILQPTRINVKAGTYANTTTARTLAQSGAATLPLWWRGYLSTPGDQDTNNVAVAGTDIPDFTFTTAQLTISATTITFSAISFTSAQTGSTTGSVNLSGSVQLFYGCQFTSTGANANSMACNSSAGGSPKTFERCKFTANAAATAALRNASGNMNISDCVMTGGITNYTAATGTAGNFNQCVFDSAAGDALGITGGSGSLILTNCSIYAPTGNGVNIITVPTGGCVIKNNYFENVNQASKAAINNTSGTNSSQIICIGNAFFNCTATYTGLSETFTILDGGTLASVGFLAGSTQNFTMLKVGQNIGAGGTFESTSTYQGFRDVGAVQGAHANRSRSFSGF